MQRQRWWLAAAFLAVALMFLVIPAPESSAAPEAGKIPLNYPKVATTAKAGDWVLAPPRLWVDQAFQKGADKQTFIWYAASMVQPGPAESRIKDLMGKEAVIPNSLIVPIRKGEKAKVGDVILTWWQSGSGMERAMVVKGGTPTAPMVRYLDMDLDNPSGCGKKEDTCKPNSFHVLKKPMEPGTAVAYKDKTWGWKHGIVGNVSGNKVLVIGFAGSLVVMPKADCLALPIRPAVKKGDACMVPNAAVFVKAKVEKVDPVIGRVFVSGTMWKKDKPYAVAFGNVIPKLP